MPRGKKPSGEGAVCNRKKEAQIYQPSSLWKQSKKAFTPTSYKSTTQRTNGVASYIVQREEVEEHCEPRRNQKLMECDRLLNKPEAKEGFETAEPRL